MIWPQEEFSRRLCNIRAKMRGRGLDVLVIYSGPGSMRFGQRGHVMYVSGHEPYFGDTMVILPLDESLSPVLEIGAAAYFPLEATWIEDVRPPGDFAQTLKKYLKENNLGKSKVGIVGEYTMSPPIYNHMKREVSRDIAAASDILENERAVKSEYEVDCIRKASQIAEKGIEEASQLGHSGVSEAAIQGGIERVCRIAGSEFFPHHTMVTSGKEPTSTSWWYGDRKLREGDPWLVDFGTMYKGYCCDICRPISVGTPSKEQEDVFEVLLRAQKAGERVAREGVLASEVDRAVAEVIMEAWGREWWGTGHGVGLEVHEWPFVGYQRILHSEAYRDMELRENMVISIEPIAYFPEAGEMQIEDEFRITRAGCERLNDIPREIIQS
ncbi:MAG: Xaa-Pro peptidase family protein [Candidatus Bathyarchaeota archaeon]|nr:Xaa-Pro peptidase family protein [Candidatus Bathyarchaeota archaeon]